MRFDGCLLLLGTLILAAPSGCGYLPSELAKPGKGKPQPHARVNAVQHTTSCGTPARGFRRLRFDDLYITTGDPDVPFRESSNRPAQYDVRAYVWGYGKCRGCRGGDHYWLIERGPEGDFSTWVVTPQYPRITIQSTCSQQLKVGQRYRFSFSRGKLVGFSR